MHRSLLSFLLTSSLALTVASAQDLELVVPIDGVQGVDYFIEFYFDHNNAGGIADYQCGRKTWDDHVGTNFALRDFAQMDSGVSVLAAADGVVLWASDGEFDRNTEWGMVSGLGNQIAIQHEGGWVTFYGHLRRNSVRIDDGDTVTAGMKIAEVGSSGSSAGPRLYFEVSDSLYEYRDPFGDGECEELPTLWIDPPAYRTAFALLDSGLLDRIPTFADLLDPPETSREFAYPDSVVTFWMKLENVSPDDQFSVIWERAEGGVEFIFSFEPPDDVYSIYYYMAWLRLPADGEYRVTSLWNSQLIASREFTVGEISGIVEESEPAVGLNLRYVAGREPSVLMSSKGDRTVRDVTLSLYDLQGRHICTLLESSDVTTDLRLPLPVDRIPSGQYILQVEADGESAGMLVVVP